MFHQHRESGGAGEVQEGRDMSGHSMWFEAHNGIVRPQPATRVVNLSAWTEARGAATVIAHAYGDMSGALLDFKSEILQARTADDAVGIANLLRELMVKVIEMEDLALKTADLLTNGSAA